MCEQLKNLLSKTVDLKAYLIRNINNYSEILEHARGCASCEGWLEQASVQLIEQDPEFGEILEGQTIMDEADLWPLSEQEKAMIQKRAEESHLEFVGGSINVNRKYIFHPKPKISVMQKLLAPSKDSRRHTGSKKSFPYLFSVQIAEKDSLNNGKISESSREEFKKHNISLSENITIKVLENKEAWEITDNAGKWLITKEEQTLNTYSLIEYEPIQMKGFTLILRCLEIGYRLVFTSDQKDKFKNHMLLLKKEEKLIKDIKIEIDEYGSYAMIDNLDPGEYELAVQKEDNPPIISCKIVIPQREV